MPAPLERTVTSGKKVESIVAKTPGWGCKLAVLLAAGAAFSLAGAVADVGGVYGENLNFERGDIGWKLPPAYSIRSGEGQNGTAALVYENSDPKLPYAFPVYYLTLKTGVVYRVSAKIRTENLDPKDGRGAQLCLFCENADGKWAREHYSPGVRGTADWTEVELITNHAIPVGTVRCGILAYCTPHTTGKACFDDIQVVPYEKAVVGTLFSSAYRNLAVTGQVDFCVDLAIPDRYSPDDVKGVFTYLNVKGVRERVKVKPSARNFAGFSIDVAKLKSGKSEIGFVLLAPDGTKLGEAKLPFRRAAKLPKRRVWIDEHKRTIVDGKPFFPFGMFSGNSNRFAEYVKGPFNTFMPYQPLDAVQMDFFHTNGIKVIYSVKDVYAAMAERAPSCVTTPAAEDAYVQAKVDAFRTHPALLAWYVNDERVLELYKPLLARQKLLERLDPDHPTWAVFYQYDLLSRMAPTYDIVGTDPYPVPERSLSRVTEATRKTRDSLFGMRAMWQVPQAFDWGVYRNVPSRMPTVMEMKSMFWQMIAAGANGLILYSYSAIQYGKRKDGTPLDFNSQWAAVCEAGEEIKRFIPVLASEPGQTVTGVPDAWGMRTWRKDGETWLLLVNAQDKADAAEVALASDFASVAAELGPAAQKTSTKTLTVSLAPNQPALYRIK